VALGRYIDEDGGVELFRSDCGGGRLWIGFEVYGSRYRATEKAVRDERTGNGPWVWQPKRGLHRRRTS